MTESDRPGLHEACGNGRNGIRRHADEVLSRTFSAVPESVVEVRTLVAAYAANMGAGPSVVQAAKLAASEAATNVVMHAYRRDPGLIHVESSVAGGELRVSVEDTGSGLRDRDDSPGLGLGLGIIRGLADTVDLSPGDEGGLRVRMRFVLAATAIDS